MFWQSNHTVITDILFFPGRSHRPVFSKPFIQRLSRLLIPRNKILAGCSAILAPLLLLHLAHFSCAFISTDLLVVRDTLIDMLLNVNTLQLTAAHQSHRQHNSPALLSFLPPVLYRSSPH
jgi:hypothetical protein